MSDQTGDQETPAQAKEIDWKAEARKWETRAKENFDALASKESAIQELTAKNEALTGKVKDLETVISEGEKEKAFAQTLAEVAEATGVPAAALRGSTREELEAHAETLKPFVTPSGPVAPKAGDAPEKTSGGEEIEFVRGLFGRE
ncbi:hypothetical protein [Jonesia denitrificans]|uniref:Scaffolding protein n=1 Tax=Jonesia denitrificans (strain ATCC 14870 / DSM 20603 / BCRC 15368 / CIP 55.134 / JCM 11481 / NBRC 15587 / NCTC 10816 / Prevot 55134) TaxID=471856 RepID=C7R256_JONDD|nr:hypothetical protein [Jonesia denitrificans]ACV09944.1 hypothetical protein Jden_2309 [Jonesia denitrificans DSM 20603]ASE08817.1 hypothetical protein CEP80_06470 [Jonesia denitrificans]ASE08874.1 hypothetical protein CEP80_06770 [Jonesia denitrificans]QXB43422.1 hypothetical protein I6L70_00430 [Jonesia denitrificans]SQH22702.1 Uncharacterised protein [Jonesia denitrificans]